MATVSESSSDESTQLQSILERFIDALGRGSTPNLDEFLAAGNHHPVLVAELVHIDFERRLDAGENVRVEEYLSKYPSLNNDQSVLFELIATEFRMRRRTQADLPFEEYQKRFPQHQQALTTYLESAPPRTSVCMPGAGTGRTAVYSLPHTQIVQPKPTDRPHLADENRATIGVPGGVGQDPPPAARTNIPGYEILGELGRGGMGVVYKARQSSLKRLVALKMILSGSHAGANDLARFRSEAEAVARLQNPNIVQIYEVGEHDGFPYFSLEFIDGGTLSHNLHNKAMPSDAAARLMRALALAIDSAHQQKIVHRDLKPDNVLLTKDGTPKITDFGLAKQLDNATHNTQSGTVMGTPGYMAPEQALGRTREIGPASDIYSLGAIFYEMLTGRPPFQGETPVDTMLLVVSQEPTSPSRIEPNIPRDLETICLKCLQKEARHRYETAKDLADELERFLNNQPIQARRIGMAGRTWRWCRRNPVVAALSVQAALALIAVAVLFYNKVLNPTPVPTHTLVTSSQDDGGDNLPAPEVVDPYRPQLVSLEKRLEQAHAEKDLEEIDNSLAELAQKIDPPPSDDRKKWIAALQTITRLKGPDAGQRNLAMQSAKQMLQDPAPVRAVKICEALAECAHHDPALLADARAVLKQTLDKEGVIVKPLDRKEIAKFLKELLTDHVRQEVLARKGNWNELLDQTKEDLDNADGWVLAARAEALLEKNSGKVSEIDLKQAQDAAFKEKETPQAGGYMSYVRALVFDASDDASSAAGEILKAYSGEEKAPAVLVPARQQRAIQLLTKAALRLRAETNPDDPFQPPFSERNVAKSFQWLNTAYTMATAAKLKPDAALLVNLALAAWHQTTPNAAFVEQVIAQIPPNEVSPADKLPLLVAKAQAWKSDPKHQADALLCYADLLQQLSGPESQDQGGIVSSDKSKRVFNTVVEPGIAIGQKLKVAAGSDAKQREALAQLFAAKGRLVSKDAAIIDDAMRQQWWDAYDQALKLSAPANKLRAEFIVQRDIASMWMKKVDLKQFERDAIEAEKIDPDYAGSHFLMGYVRQGEARTVPQAERKKLMEGALAEYSIAIALLVRIEDPNRELFVYYQYRMNTLTALARLDTANAITHLDRAVLDAAAAIAKGPSKPDQWYEAKGNVLEELNAITGKFEKLEEAVAAFEQARKSRPDNIAYAIASGRCKYKALAADAGQPKPRHASYQKEAIDLLGRVVEGRGFPKKPTDAEKAEALYWQAKVNELRKGVADAEKGFDAVVALKDKAAARKWVLLALEGGAELALNRALQQADTKADEAVIKPLLAKARANADQLSAYPDKAATAAFLRARALEAEQLPAQALEAYLKELTRQKSAPGGVQHWLTLRMMELYFNPKWREKLREARLPGTDAEAMAKEADDLLQRAKANEAQLADASGFAGLAHVEAINPDDVETAKKHRQSAIDNLRLASQKSAIADEKGWIWRFELAKQLETVMRSDDARKAELRKEALQWTREALQGKVPDNYKREVQNLLKTLNE